VLLGLEGTLELEVAGRGCRIGPGDGWVVPPGERHDFESHAGSRCLVLDTATPGWLLCADAPQRPAQAFALARYLAGALDGGMHHALQAGPLLLLDAWAPNREAAAYSHDPARSRRRIDWAALSAWSRLRWHLALTVADLASQVHLSPTQFATR